MKPPPVKRDICGSQPGYNSHNRHGESQCDPCRKAQAEYMRDYRRRIGFTVSTLYTPAQIEDIKQQAAADALRKLHSIHLTRRASRVKNYSIRNPK